MNWRIDILCVFSFFSNFDLNYRSLNVTTTHTCMAWASSRRSSSVFIVTNLSTSKFNDAATIASPNNIKISANMTYSGFLFSALSFCSATISPKPAITQMNAVWTSIASHNHAAQPLTDGCQCYETIINRVEIAPVFEFRKRSRTASNRQWAERCHHTNQIQFGRNRVPTIERRLYRLYDIAETTNNHNIHNKLNLHTKNHCNLRSSPAQSVYSFTDALEHDQPKRNADNCIAHCE